MTRLSSMFGVVAAVVLGGCADLSKYTKEASHLSQQLSPQASELVTASQALVERSEKLPADRAGDLPGRVASNHAELQQLQTRIDGLPASITESAKTKNAKHVAALLDEQKGALTTQLGQSATTLKALSDEVSAAEGEAQKGKAAGASGEAGAEFSRNLNSGFVVKGAAGGFEAQLLAFIEDKARPVDKTTWLTFDRMPFKGPAAELDLEASKEQLANVAEILKAFPKVRLRIGGFTDNQGPAPANKKLSLERAKAVLKAIVTNGIPAGRLGPEAYGAEHPVCPANDTDECRAKNRRVAARVAAK